MYLDFDYESIPDERKFKDYISVIVKYSSYAGLKTLAWVRVSCLRPCDGKCCLTHGLECHPEFQSTAFWIAICRLSQQGSQSTRTGRADCQKFLHHYIWQSCRL